VFPRSRLITLSIASLNWRKYPIFRDLEGWQEGDLPLPHCFSYSPLLVFLSTVKPAFLASEMERGFRWVGVLKEEMSFLTGFLQAGHFFNSSAERGLCRVKVPPHTLHPAGSQTSYSYNGMGGG